MNAGQTETRNSGGLQPLFDAHGQYQGALAMVTDMTSHRQLEEQLRHAQKMEAVGQLAGGVAHDFNNLLTVIIGYSHLLRDDAQIEEQRVTAGEILAAAERGAGLTRQLLAFSRRQIMQLVILDLNSLVAEVSQMLRRVIGEQVELVMRLSPGPAQVKADAGQLEQVLLNLAVNARDAMESGGRLTIETSRVGTEILLAVRDTGCGMDEPTRTRIFEPFFTTKGLGRGTGLGLAMVFGLVTGWGGRLEVDSEPGAGAVFRIYLPEVAPTAGASATPAAQSHRGSGTILLVEDEDAVRGIGSRMLLRLGYQVLEANGAEQARALLQEHLGRIDLLLTDVIMPGVGGPALAAELLALQPGLGLLFMSGCTDDVILRQGVREAGLPFLEKPFTAERLGSKVQEALLRRPLPDGRA